MPLLKWTDVYGKTFVINPMHIVSIYNGGLTYGGTANTTAIVNFTGGYHMEIGLQEAEEFTKLWYTALNKKEQL